MGLEDTVRQILSCRRDFKYEEIMDMIEKKKNGSNGFLTDETAARMVASELGVNIIYKPVQLRIQIQDLFSGLNDVSISGKVVVVYQCKTFTRRNWTEGKIANIVISDKSGTLRVVLWDKNAEIIEKGKIQKEQQIVVLHGYVREGNDGKLELHLGEKGKIRIISDTCK